MQTKGGECAVSKGAQSGVSLGGSVLPDRPVFQGSVLIKGVWKSGILCE